MKDILYIDTFFQERDAELKKKEESRTSIEDMIKNAKNKDQ